MTRPRSIHRQIAAVAARLVTDGKVPPTTYHLRYPGGFRDKPAGWIWHRVAMKQDGRALDADEARTTFADQPWARRAMYCGTARGLHCFARPPEGER